MVKGSAASEMGLLPGDKITFIDNKEILTQEDLIQEVSSRPDEEVLFIIERNQQSFSKLWGFTFCKYRWKD
ncbi:MAG: hypothetical protein Ct9H90mP4_05280 [Gammaproteobacteria bacterium]|nr:MAG: hypothetical protein Ct9H90mP4_05280 [Gammaproteobacteria bacterium]